MCAHFLYIQAPRNQNKGPRPKAHPPVLGSLAPSVPQHPMLPPQRDPPSTKHHPYRHRWNHNSVRWGRVFGSGQMGWISDISRWEKSLRIQNSPGSTSMSSILFCMWQLGVCILKSKLLTQSYKYVWIQPLYALRGCAMHHLFPSLLSSRCIDGIESFTGPFASCKPRIGNPSSCMVQEITDSAKPGTTQELRIRSGEWVWKALQAKSQTNKQTNKQTNEQTNKQTNKQTGHWRWKDGGCSAGHYDNQPCPLHTPEAQIHHKSKFSSATLSSAWATPNPAPGALETFLNS